MEFGQGTCVPVQTQIYMFQYYCVKEVASYGRSVGLRRRPLWGHGGKGHAWCAGRLHVVSVLVSGPGKRPVGCKLACELLMLSEAVGEVAETDPIQRVCRA